MDVGAVGEAIQIGLLVLISIASVLAIARRVVGRPHLGGRSAALTASRWATQGGTSRTVYRLVAIASPVTWVFSTGMTQEDEVRAINLLVERIRDSEFV